jgi:HK97 family phage major capsid protein
MDSKTLREKRAKLASDANAILATAVHENRASTADELAQVDKIHADVDALKATIDRVERSADEERMYAPESQREQREPPADEAAEARAHNTAFRKYLIDGPGALTSEDVRALGGLKTEKGVNGAGLTLSFRSIRESLAALREKRAAQTVTTSGGGYVIAREFSDRLEKSLLFYGGMLQNSSVFDTATGAPLDWPTYDDTSVSGRLLAINTGATQTGMTFGSVTFDAYKYSSDYVLVPVELMQDSAFDINAIVADVLGERLGRILNNHMTVGTGSAQPNGVITAAGTGVTGATGQTTSVTFDNIVDLVYSLDRAYRMNAKFMMNDASIKVLRKLKDGNGMPIWQAGGPTAGEPDTLFGYPVIANNDVAVMGANAKSIAFGDFSKYKIRRVKDVTLLRLNERFADAHQVAFLAFARFDGDLLDAGTDPIKLYVNSAT